MIECRFFINLGPYRCIFIWEVSIGRKHCNNASLCFLGDEGQSALLISIPSFDLTHSCVLVRVGEGGSVMGAEELSFTSSLHQSHNPQLEEQLGIQQQETARSSVAGSEGGDVTLLHLMDEDDDD